MATEFTLPDLGENITSGDVVSVLVSAGDTVTAGQAVLEVETDKAVIDANQHLQNQELRLETKQRSSTERRLGDVDKPVGFINNRSITMSSQ